jgi:hypothetical protein
MAIVKPYTMKNAPGNIKYYADAFSNKQPLGKKTTPVATPLPKAGEPAWAPPKPQWQPTPVLDQTAAIMAERARIAAINAANYQRYLQDLERLNQPITYGPEQKAEAVPAGAGWNIGQTDRYMPPATGYPYGAGGFHLPEQEQTRSVPEWSGAFGRYMPSATGYPYGPGGWNLLAQEPSALLQDAEEQSLPQSRSRDSSFWLTYPPPLPKEMRESTPGNIQYYQDAHTGARRSRYHIPGFDYNFLSNIDYTFNPALPATAQLGTGSGAGTGKASKSSGGGYYGSGGYGDYPYYRYAGGNREEVKSWYENMVNWNIR